MPLPTFAPPAHTPARPQTLNRIQAAARLGLTPPGIDKMLRAHMLTHPIRTDSIDELAGRDRLTVTDGELTVLRTDARAASDPAKYPEDDRKWIGFDVGHSDPDLEASSLRWWRCDPRRVVDNELLAVTVATYPVAVYRILELMETIVRPDETTTRHRFRGQLLARVHPGMVPTFPQDTPGHLRTLAKQIMASTITVDSGGPIGYLESRP